MNEQERKVMEMALEALEFAASEIYNERNDDIIANAIVALHTTLAQPEQDYIKRLEDDFRRQLDELSQRNYELRHPPKNTAPSSKPWVELTVDEIYQAADREKQQLNGFVQGALWAEAALWEKNNGN